MPSKPPLSRYVALLVLAFALAPRATADVLVVDQGGGGDFTDIWLALDAAATGDTVLVKSGTFGDIAFSNSFSVEEDLVITADVGATVIVAAGGPPDALDDLIKIQNLLVGSKVLIRGITFRGFDFSVTNNAGQVRFEDCTFEGKRGLQLPLLVPVNGAPGVLVEDSASVAFHHCTLIGGEGQTSTGTIDEVSSSGGPGLSVSGSTVAATNCSLTGGVAGDNFSLPMRISESGGDGLVVTDSSVLIFGCTVTGGEQPFTPGFCFSLSGNGLTITDTSSRVRILDVTFAAGVAGSGICPGVDIDAPGGTIKTATGPARDLSLDSPIRENMTATLTATGVPGDDVFAFFSVAAGHLTIWSSRGVFLLGTPFWGPMALGSITSGPLVVSVTAPDLPPSMLAVTLHVQTIHVNAGAVLLGPMTMPTVLDENL